MDDELSQAKSELRFLTLELMKIAVERNVPFDEVLEEFIQNVYKMEVAVMRGITAKRKTKEMMGRGRKRG